MDAQNFIKLLICKGQSHRISPSQIEASSSLERDIATLCQPNHRPRRIDASKIAATGLRCHAFEGLACSETNLQNVVIWLDSELRDAPARFSLMLTCHLLSNHP